MNRSFNIKNQYLVVSLLMTFMLGIISNDSKAQSLWNNWSVNIGANALQYYGDISNTNYFEKYDGETRLGVNLNLEKQVNSWFACGGQVLYGELAGYRKGVHRPDGTVVTDGKMLVFSSKLFAYNLYMKFSARPLLPESIKNRFDIYGKVGIGLSNWASTLNDEYRRAVVTSGSTDDGLDGLTTETVVPFAAGVSYMFNRNIGVGFEISMCPVNSDMLDCLESGNSKIDFYSQTVFSVIVPLHYGSSKSNNTRYSNYEKAPRKYKHTRPLRNRNH